MATNDSNIRVCVDKKIGKLYNFWSTSVCTTQHQFADRANHAKIRQAHPYAKYMNCVRLLGGMAEKDDYFRGIASDGEALCDFRGLIANVRGIVECGFIPRLVLDNVPAKMTDFKEQFTYGNTLPPTDPAIWHSYIRQLVQTLVDEMGYDTVKRWRFRVGTEPDLYPGHWSGTQVQYYRHYDNTVDAVAQVIADADIGPGNILDPMENPRRVYPHKRWGIEIVDHCGAGLNYVTREIGTQMQFFATSWYGHVGADNHRFDKAMVDLKGRLGRYRQYANTPIEIHEFAVLTDENGKRLWDGDASEWGASWMADIATRVYEHQVAEVYQWATTSYGVANPRTHVLSLLERMVGGERCSVTGTEQDASDTIGCIPVAYRSGLRLLVYRHCPQRGDGGTRDVRINLEGLRLASGNWRIANAFQIDKDHSVFIHQLYEDIAQEGIPALPDGPIFGSQVGRRYGPPGQRIFEQFRDRYVQIGALAPISLDDAIAQTEKGLALQLVMKRHSVVYIELEPVQVGQ